MDEKWSDVIINTKPINPTTELVDLVDENRFRIIRDVKAHIVAINEEMRIDLVCRELYGGFEYIHELLKINEICNPWSIKKGDVLYNSSMNRIEDMVGYGTDFSDEREQLIEAFKKSQVDPTRYEFLKAIKSKNNENTETVPLPSTVIPPGFKDVVIDNGYIVVTPTLSNYVGTYDLAKDIRDKQIEAIKKLNKGLEKTQYTKEPEEIKLTKPLPKPQVKKTETETQVILGTDYIINK